MWYDDRLVIRVRQPDGSHKIIDGEAYEARAHAPIDEADASALAAFARAQADLYLRRRDEEAAAASEAAKKGNRSC